MVETTGTPEAEAREADSVTDTDAAAAPDAGSGAPQGPPRPPEDLAAARACEAELTRLDVRYEVRPALDDGACGAERPVEVTAVGAIALDPPATLRCAPALATARWVREVVAPSARLHMAAEAQTVVTASSYVCRTRRTAAGSDRLSEHATANALDVSAIRLADGRAVPVMPRDGSAAPERAFQAAVRGGACALFTTVLGPGSNALHADHLHLDLAARRNGGKLCE